MRSFPFIFYKICLGYQFLTLFSKKDREMDLSPIERTYQWKQSLGEGTQPGMRNQSRSSAEGQDGGPYQGWEYEIPSLRSQ